MKFLNFLKSKLIFKYIPLFLNVCKQIFQIPHVGISQKVKGILMGNLSILFLYEDEDIGRFSNLH